MMRFVSRFAAAIAVMLFAAVASAVSYLLLPPLLPEHIAFVDRQIGAAVVPFFSIMILYNAWREREVI